MGYKNPPKPMTPEGLKAYRQKHNMTQGDLANLLTVSLRTIENWEQGERTIPLHVPNTLRLVAKLRRADA